MSSINSIMSSYEWQQEDDKYKKECYVEKTYNLVCRVLKSLRHNKLIQLEALGSLIDLLEMPRDKIGVFIPQIINLLENSNYQNYNMLFDSIKQEVIIFLNRE